ncbi:MAG: YaaA family protein [Ilumatobacteraceae bacterium]
MASRRTSPLAILLPPSEGKAEGGRTPRWKAGSGTFGSALRRPRAEVVAALLAAKGGDAKLLGVSGQHLARAQESNRELDGAPTVPACERYTGVVWGHLSPDTLSAKGRARAVDSVVVVSGLLGLVGFDDPVPDYRVKMGASLKPMGKLSTWWRDPLSTTLNDWADGRVVIDLLPNEHRAAWTPGDSMREHVVVSFVEKSGKVAGHDAKAAKGLLARHLLEKPGDPMEALRSWTHPRFRLSY